MQRPSSFHPMELRVWLEGGPQRVVCGVTEATTCQDVVYALAQATAQTGRFALVERCRRSERPLAPSDRPLRLLARRAGASDVHFLLRRCGPPPPPIAPTGLRSLEGAVRPRRPPPYDEAVTRLAEGRREEEERAELLALVGRQKERLHALAQELAHRDAELLRWAPPPPSSSPPPSPVPSLEEQLQRLRQEERTLRSELALARSQLASCEGRLLQCRERLCQLGHQVSVAEAAAEGERRWRRRGPKEEEEEEEEGALLAERRRLVSQLSEELRAANLEALALADADHKHWLEAASGGFFNRPGSTRKIVGSPRQLENAVPTSKNPNGVWV